MIIPNIWSKSHVPNDQPASVYKEVFIRLPTRRKEHGTGKSTIYLQMMFPFKPPFLVDVPMSSRKVAAIATEKSNGNWQNLYPFKKVVL